MKGEVRSPPQSEHFLAGSTIIGMAFPRVPAWDRFSDLLVEKTDGDSVLGGGIYELISKEKCVPWGLVNNWCPAWWDATHGRDHCTSHPST